MDNFGDDLEKELSTLVDEEPSFKQLAERNQAGLLSIPST